MNELITTIGLWIEALPSAIGALLIFFVGWAVAKLLKSIVPALLKWLKFDVLSEKIGFDEFLRKGNARYTPSALIGVILYWIVILLVLARAAALLDSRVAESITSWLAGAIPMVLRYSHHCGNWHFCGQFLIEFCNDNYEKCRA